MLETIQIQKLHILTLHILSQPGVCAWVWDSSGASDKSATNGITVSPLLLRHLGSPGLRLLTLPFWTGLVRLEIIWGATAFWATGKSKAIMYHSMQAYVCYYEMQSADRTRWRPKCFVLFEWTQARKLLPLGDSDSSSLTKMLPGSEWNDVTWLGWKRSKRSLWAVDRRRFCYWWI